MSKTFYKGIDVSEHQGHIDWEMVKAAGVEFVIPRDGYGLYTEDKIFPLVIAGAQDKHIDIPAIYHFSYATTKDNAIAEAKFAINECKKYGLPKSTIIFYDFEYDSKRYFDSCEMKKKAKDRKTLTPAMVQEFTTAFCDTIEEAGYIPGVYFNQDYYQHWYNNGGSFKSNWIKWLADYEGDPLVPTEFRQTGSAGKISGIKGAVDLDEANFDYKTLSKDKPETKPQPKPAKKSNEEIAKEVIAGKWGNGSDRRARLTTAGYNYNEVQSIVNSMLPKESPKKGVTEAIVNAVIRGDYGNGDARKTRLEADGYVYKEVQDAVNKKLSGTPVQSSNSMKVSPAQSQDASLTGKYKVTASALNLRYIPGLFTDSNVVKVLPRDTVVQCWGYYTQKANSKWLLVQVGTITGFVDMNYLTRI